MYVAMNRFLVRCENAQAFEALWLGRDSQLQDVPGFLEFQMLKGPEADGLLLYASHSVWESEAAFRDWTRSEAFRAAHKDVGAQKVLYEGPPVFEGFTSIQRIS